MLSNTPYRCFPFTDKGAIVGFMTRDSIEKALSLGKMPVYSAACFASKDATVKDAAENFINFRMVF